MSVCVCVCLCVNHLSEMPMSQFQILIVRMKANSPWGMGKINCSRTIIHVQIDQLN